MHKFAVVHKQSGIVCYSSDTLAHCVAPSFAYEIVNNSIDFKTVTPNLNFDSYSEIADALELSDKIVFYTDADDNLTVSDGSRSVTIPALLFQETLLDVEESVFGDVCEIVEDYSFNRDCTELLARNAVKFFTAARFLELSPTTETETETETPTETTETPTASKEMSEYKTVPPNFIFSDYTEIADALELSDKIVFSTDADDNLTISDNVWSVTLPALLFNKVCLEVEEVVFWDVYEIVERYGFNNDRTELLAHNAVKFWVAVRFLETTETTMTTTETTTETTETIEVIAENLEIHDSSEFVGELAFTYQGYEYLLGDFMTTNKNGWHGVMGLNYFSAYYVQFHERVGNLLNLGYAYW